eukprot:Opistho-1_new@58496
MADGRRVAQIYLRCLHLLVVDEVRPLGEPVLLAVTRCRVDGDVAAAVAECDLLKGHLRPSGGRLDLRDVGIKGGAEDGADKCVVAAVLVDDLATAVGDAVGVRFGHPGGALHPSHSQVRAKEADFGEKLCKLSPVCSDRIHRANGEEVFPAEFKTSAPLAGRPLPLVVRPGKREVVAAEVSRHFSLRLVRLSALVKGRDKRRALAHGRCDREAAVKAPEHRPEHNELAKTRVHRQCREVVPERREALAVVQCANRTQRLDSRADGVRLRRLNNTQEDAQREAAVGVPKRHELDAQDHLLERNAAHFGLLRLLQHKVVPVLCREVVADARPDAPRTPSSLHGVRARNRRRVQTRHPCVGVVVCLSHHHAVHDRRDVIDRNARLGNVRGEDDLANGRRRPHERAPLVLV